MEVLVVTSQKKEKQLKGEDEDEDEEEEEEEEEEELDVRRGERAFPEDEPDAETRGEGALPPSPSTTEVGELSIWPNLNVLMLAYFIQLAETRGEGALPPSSSTTEVGDLPVSCCYSVELGFLNANCSFICMMIDVCFVVVLI